MFKKLVICVYLSFIDSTNIVYYFYLPNFFCFFFHSDTKFFFVYLSKPYGTRLSGCLFLQKYFCLRGTNRGSPVSFCVFEDRLKQVFLSRFNTGSKQVHNVTQVHRSRAQDDSTGAQDDSTGAQHRSEQERTGAQRTGSRGCPVSCLLRKQEQDGSRSRKQGAGSREQGTAGAGAVPVPV